MHGIEAENGVIRRQDGASAIAKYGIDALFAKDAQDDIGARQALARWRRRQGK
jgi:predicted NBD/HSP70 family sugar kinase